MLSQALSKRESISGCDPDEIYYQLNFYHFAVERQSGTGNCSPVTRKHYQKITTFRCTFRVAHDKKLSDAHPLYSMTKENSLKEIARHSFI